MGVPLSTHNGQLPMLPPAFAAVPGLAGVSPLNAIPGGIPVLLPMPPFTAEQLANLNKGNLFPTALHPANPDSKDVKAVTAVKPKSTLKPIVQAFQPFVNSEKLEDIKEEDENELMDSLPNSSYPLMLDGIDLCDTKQTDDGSKTTGTDTARGREDADA